MSYLSDCLELEQAEKTWSEEVLRDFERVYNKQQELLDFLNPWIAEIEKQFGTIENNKITIKEL